MMIIGANFILNKILEVRWHGRGGQGAWTASELLARGAIQEGKYIQSFPEFGPERMGAPVTSFTRISEDPIKMHCSVYTPDVVAVLDPTLLKTVNVTNGLKDAGSIIVNTTESPSQMRQTLNTSAGHLWTVPATEIAIKILGRPITNTAMLGAVTRVTEIITLESLEKVVKNRFKKDLAERNITIITQAYKEVTSE
jgi:2-oxoacid:acceptor oxidoreductase gamma subunit (pyruvate/2-ketoisovalerate family)